MASKLTTEKTNGLTCRVCGKVVQDFLGDHLVSDHGVSVEDYLVMYPGAETMSQRLVDRWKAESGKSPRRRHSATVEDLTVDISGFTFKVDHRISADACLPLPPHYRFPTHQNRVKTNQCLARDVRHALMAINRFMNGQFYEGEEVTSLYVHGISGSGKDAFFHALSSMLRRPGIIRSIKPGVDISSWFYSRAFDSQGTAWEEGPLLKALRDGYEVRDAKGNVVDRVPYMVLITDFDRADRAQAEYLRLITDTIQGRVEGPEGMAYPVLPGTLIAATGNTAGAGDERGRYVSANVIDGSIINRFSNVFEFHWMLWEDEEPVAKAKFPELVEKAPWIFDQMGKATAAIREAILGDELYTDFDHRCLCAILRHACNYIAYEGQVPGNVLRVATRTWIDRLGDSETKDKAKKLMDPHIKNGMLDRGDESRHKAGKPSW